MLSRKEVQHIAKLARLGLTEKEVNKFRKELSEILDYMAKLKEIEVAKVKPTSHPLKVENMMRRDEAKKEKRKILLGFLKVKSILK